MPGMRKRPTFAPIKPMTKAAKTEKQPEKPEKPKKPQQEVAKKGKGGGKRGGTGKSFKFPAVTIGAKKGKVPKKLKVGEPQPATQVIARTYRVRKDD